MSIPACSWKYLRSGPLIQFWKKFLASMYSCSSFTTTFVKHILAFSITTSSCSSIAIVETKRNILPIGRLTTQWRHLQSCTVLYAFRVVGISILVYHRLHEGEDWLLNTWGLLIKTTILIFIPQAIPSFVWLMSIRIQDSTKRTPAFQEGDRTLLTSIRESEIEIEAIERVSNQSGNNNKEMDRRSSFYRGEFLSFGRALSDDK